MIIIHMLINNIMDLSMICHQSDLLHVPMLQTFVAFELFLIWSLGSPDSPELHFDLLQKAPESSMVSFPGIFVSELHIYLTVTLNAEFSGKYFQKNHCPWKMLQGKFCRETFSR